MNNCPDCERLQREADRLRKLARESAGHYEAWEAATAELVRHQTACHVWHMATATKAGAR